MKRKIAKENGADVDSLPGHVRRLLLSPVKGVEGRLHAVKLVAHVAPFVTAQQVNHVELGCPEEVLAVSDDAKLALSLVARLLVYFVGLARFFIQQPLVKPGRLCTSVRRASGVR